MLNRSTFNDVSLDEQRTLLRITEPDMGDKSTHMQ